MFKELIQRIANALNVERIPYMIIGGQAILYYGEPRFTKDIDITLGIDVDKLDYFRNITSILKLKILVDKVNDFVRKTMVLPCIDESTNIRIDFIFSNTDYERQAIQRSVEIKFDEIPVKIASFEDVVIHKIIAGRPRDIEDIKSILMKNSKYDKKYISDWLRKFDQSLDQSFINTFEIILKDIE